MQKTKVKEKMHLRTFLLIEKWKHEQSSLPVSANKQLLIIMITISFI